MSCDIVQPIGGLDELWKWKGRGSEEPIFEEPLKHYQKHNGPEVLLCHDMKGGYLEEESSKGCKVDEKCQPYTFLNWWNIDIFCYFSHNFVTIPPLDYTRIAHKHGCLSMGTFITEWTGGKALCERFLESRQSIEDTVDALVVVAKHFGFDGWLINIENVIQKEKVPEMVYFVQLLTEKSRVGNENSRVIWYDSVTHDGKLKWQNALNTKNKCFYDACDGIYLNYNWTEEMLLDSADFGLLEKIFVGIDVFARGCIGGFDTWKSFAKAKLFRMSVALFAPGWICEKFPDQNQITEGIRFWQKLYPYIRSRPLLQPKISTNFGVGWKYEKEDEESTTMFRLSAVNVQPHCLDSRNYPVKDGLKLSDAGDNLIFKLCCNVKAGESLTVSWVSSSDSAEVLIEYDGEAEDWEKSEQNNKEELSNRTFTAKKDIKLTGIVFRTHVDNVIVSYLEIK